MKSKINVQLFYYVAVTCVLSHVWGDDKVTPELELLIGNIQTQEVKTEKIDWSYEFRSLPPAGHVHAESPPNLKFSPKGSGVLRALERDETWRRVRQGLLLRNDLQAKLVYDSGHRQESVTRIAFDGDRTRRSYESNLFRWTGNINDARTVLGEVLPSHSVLEYMLRTNRVYPLSVHLSGDSAMSQYPDYHFKSGTVSAKLSGRTRIRDLDCDIITVSSTSGGLPASRFVFYIAPARSYQPVRLETYSSRLSDEIVCSYAEVEEFFEVEPDTWFVKSAAGVAYDPLELMKHKKQVVSQRLRFTTTSVDLNPTHPKEFFSDVPLKDGMFVVERDAVGVPKKKYTVGQNEKTATPSGR